MAEKISTLILKVDLDCHLCYKKIKKVLCKLQEKENVKAIFYDEKNKTVTVAGAFNPDKVSNWLCCKACKIIKEIEIKDEKPKNEKLKDEKPKNDNKPKDEKPKKDDNPKTVKFKDDKPKDEKPKHDKPKDDKPKGPKPAESEGKPKLVPQKAQPELPKTEPVIVGGFPQLPYQPGWPASPAGPGCCFRPLYEGFYGGCRCCTCGRVYGYMAGAGAPMGLYGGPVPAIPYGEYKGCQFSYEEDSSYCTIM